jgi:hypothetical protein
MARRKSTQAILAELRYEQGRLASTRERASQVQHRIDLMGATETTELLSKKRRRAFIVGEWLLDNADANLLGTVLDGLNRSLTRRGDRELFGLDG